MMPWLLWLVTAGPEPWFAESDGAAIVERGPKREGFAWLAHGHGSPARLIQSA
jgi:hypothetical protein